MNKVKQPDRPAARVARHPARPARGGTRRVEVAVPAQDVPLIKAIAGVFRAGGNGAEEIRTVMQPILASSVARTGRELVAFFRSSPLVGADLSSDRDASTGRSADIE